MSRGTPKTTPARPTLPIGTRVVARRVAATFPGTVVLVRRRKFAYRYGVRLDVDTRPKSSLPWLLFRRDELEPVGGAP